MSFVKDFLKLFSQGEPKPRENGGSITRIVGLSGGMDVVELENRSGIRLRMQHPVDSEYECTNVRYVPFGSSSWEITAYFSKKQPPPKPDYSTLPELAYITWVPQR